MDPKTVDFVNQYLAQKYGKFDDNRPKFRLIWSSTQMEKRFGVFAYSSNGIDFGTVEEEREVPKYSYCMDRWVLEQLCVNEAIPAEIRSQTLVSYEPRWVFWNGENGDYVEPNIDFIDMCCYLIMNKTLKGHKATEQELLAQKRAASAKMQAELREKLDNELPDTANALVNGEGVALNHPNFPERKQTSGDLPTT